MRRPSAPFAPPAEGEAPKGLHRRLSEGGCVTLESCGQRLGGSDVVSRWRRADDPVAEAVLRGSESAGQLRGDTA